MDRQEVVSSLGGVSLSQHLTHTFLWMTAGLAVTAIVAFLTLFSGLWITIYSFSLAPLVLLVAQLGVVIFLTGKLAKMQPSTAKLLFLAYSALTVASPSGIDRLLLIRVLKNEGTRTESLFEQLRQ